MSDDYDAWHETEVSAKNTTCPDCGLNYEVVRIGKIQPSCLCEAYKVQALNYEEALRQLNIERQKNRKYGYTEVLVDALHRYLSATDTADKIWLRTELEDLVKKIRNEMKK